MVYQWPETEGTVCDLPLEVPLEKQLSVQLRPVVNYPRPP